MSAARLESIRSFIRINGDDAFVLTSREDVRWACGFTGSNGVLIVTETYAVLFTDGRYAEQAAAEVVNVQVEIQSGDLITAAGGHEVVSNFSSVGVDGAQTSVAAFRRIQSWQGEPCVRSYDSPLASLVAVKMEDEIRRMRRAQEVTDIVFDEILGLIGPGIAEKDLAAEIVYRHLKHGADGMSFDPIVASGPNGALPHARPTERLLANGDMIVLDFGCFVEGYASDMTRTVGLGSPDSDALEAYAVVQRAQRAAQDAARSGMRACDLDRVGREIIEKAGFGDAFSHSLGHGLGLRIHEWPRLAATNEEILPENCVVTVEPGVYIQGRFGVRIENSVVLRSDECTVLPKSSTDLILL